MTLPAAGHASPAEVTRYTEGGCVLFAAEAAVIISGTELVFVTDDGGETGHAMCQLAGGRLFDVRGIHPPGNLPAHCPAVAGLPAHNPRLRRRLGLPRPAAIPLARTGHLREWEDATWLERMFARHAAAATWVLAGGDHQPWMDDPPELRAEGRYCWRDAGPCLPADMIAYLDREHPSWRRP